MNCRLRAGTISGSLEFETKTASETRRLGARIGRLLEAGDVLLFQGELGSGKTVLAQGVGQGLAVREPVKSSSFVLVNEYHGRLTVQHADLFRLEEPAQVFDLGLEEIAAPGVLIVEWPERAWSELPPEHLLVRIVEAGVGRTLTLEPRGSRYEELIEQLERRSKRGVRA
ncbi:MAG: tRNA (adenosine(37)-N6)-threonylcarbamoyltransferase complex ATPase subunit type 1 TsaE [Chloroflexi bacterium]|nr:tRNA (adenosine(37)-N6)-threonylcarbamoyltransferase complex ATPase subunit type 1 TsaE [Chloroflexota bacterium]